MTSVAGVDFRAIDKANFSITASQAGQVDRCGDGLRSTAPGAGRKSPHAYKSGTIYGLIGSLNQDAEAARRARSERGNHHHFLRKIDLRQLGSGATTLEDFRPDGAPRLHITDHDALGREHAAVAGERIGLRREASDGDPITIGDFRESRASRTSDEDKGDCGSDRSDHETPPMFVLPWATQVGSPVPCTV